jgi:hypothetical protein
MAISGIELLSTRIVRQAALIHEIPQTEIGAFRLRLLDLRKRLRPSGNAIKPIPGSALDALGKGAAQFFPNIVRKREATPQVQTAKPMTTHF